MPDTQNQSAKPPTQPRVATDLRDAYSRLLAQVREKARQSQSVSEAILRAVRGIRP